MTSGTDSDSDEFFAEKLIGNGKLDKSIIGSQESLKSESCSAKVDYISAIFTDITENKLI